jgi:hypothetical protein
MATNKTSLTTCGDHKRGLDSTLLEQQKHCLWHLDNQCLIFFHHMFQRLQHAYPSNLHISQIFQPPYVHDLDKFSEFQMLVKGVEKIRIQ